MREVSVKLWNKINTQHGLYEKLVVSKKDCASYLESLNVRKTLPLKVYSCHFTVNNIGILSKAFVQLMILLNERYFFPVQNH